MPKSPQPRRVVVVRYVNARGDRVNKGDPGARRVATRSDSYYVTLTVGERRRTFPLKTTDIGLAWERLRKLQRRIEAGETDLEDRPAIAADPLPKHVDDWLGDLAAEQVSEDRLRLLRGRLAILAAEAGWNRLADITHSSALRALDRLTKRDRRPIGPQTRNHYLDHLRQFCAWCCGPGKRMTENPAIGLNDLPAEHDMRRLRRVPTPEEIGKLFTWLDSPAADIPAGRKWTLPSGNVVTVRVGLSGRQRAMAYRVALATGLRAGELRSLRRESFDLARAVVTVSAAYSRKAAKTVEVPLPPWLVDELSVYFADAAGAMWDGFPAKTPGRILQHDLAAAGVEYETKGADGLPRFLDFHALRHHYITEIASQPGMDLKTLMTLARHSTPDLSLRVYAAVRQENVRAAVAQVPRPGGQPEIPGCAPEGRHGNP